MKSTRRSPTVAQNEAGFQVEVMSVRKAPAATAGLPARCLLDVDRTIRRFVRKAMWACSCQAVRRARFEARVTAFVQAVNDRGVIASRTALPPLVADRRVTEFDDGATCPALVVRPDGGRSVVLDDRPEIEPRAGAELWKRCSN